MDGMPQITPNHLRKTHRITLPAFAIIGDTKFPVLDWSLHGFKIKNAANFKEFIKGETLGVKFLLPFPSHDVIINTESQAIWKEGDKAGFNFTNLANDTRQQLRQFVKSGLEGNLDASGNVIVSVNPPSVTPTAAPAPDEKSLKKQRSSIVRRSALLVGLAIAAVYAAILMARQFQYSEAVTAIVNAPTFDVQAPLDGKLLQIPVAPGDAVSEGQILAVLSSNTLDLSISKKELQQEALTKKIGQLKTELEKLNLNVHAYKRIAEKNLGIRQQELKQNNTRLSLTKKELARSRKLTHSGVFANKQLDTIKSRYQELKAKQNQLQKEVELQQILVSEADKGNTFRNGELVDERSKITAQLNQAASQLFSLKKELEILKKSRQDLTLVSRSFGYITDVRYKPGAIVGKGATLLSGYSRESLWVDAAFTQKDARALSPGAEVKIISAATGIEYRGKVERFKPRSQAAATNGSAPGDSTIGVTISFDDDPAKLIYGQPVIVLARSSWHWREKLQAGISPL